MIFSHKHLMNLKCSQWITHFQPFACCDINFRCIGQSGILNVNATILSVILKPDFISRKEYHNILGCERQGYAGFNGLFRSILGCVVDNLANVVFYSRGSMLFGMIVL